MIKSVQLYSEKRPLSKGNFFNSNAAKTMYRSKEGGLTEARMDFSTGGSKLPQEVTYYQNITQKLARPFATYVKGQVHTHYYRPALKTGDNFLPHHQAHN